MSEWLVLAIVMAAACAVVLTVVLLSQRRRAADPAGDGDDDSEREAREVEIPDVLEYMTMMVGVVYAIVLGLAIAGVWEARSAAQDDVRREAQALHEVTQRAEVYPPAVRERLRQDIDTYVSHVVEKEWPRMVDGRELPERGTRLIQELRKDFSRRAPANELEAHAYQPVLDQLAVVDDARNARAESAGSTLPAVVWFGLFIGALVTVGLIFTMRMGRSFRELLLAGLFSALIAFLLFLVWDFDAPFGRSGSDSADAFRRLFPGAAGP
ncbi:bestrophin-like domain [Streptomyces sp. NPDC001985]|uniref:bestrophin-like domain n=1 Tax=Streptomyces sp. NPDC001985 TaxID=3154406 RepID=UPI00332454E2